MVWIPETPTFFRPMVSTLSPAPRVSPGKDTAQGLPRLLRGDTRAEILAIQVEYCGQSYPRVEHHRAYCVLVSCDTVTDPCIEGENIDRVYRVM